MSPGHTIFNIYDLVPKEEFNRENERVKKLGENPATGQIWEEGKPRRLPQTKPRFLQITYHGNRVFKPGITVTCSKAGEFIAFGLDTIPEALENLKLEWVSDREVVVSPSIRGVGKKEKYEVYWGNHQGDFISALTEQERQELEEGVRKWLREWREAMLFGRSSKQIYPQTTSEKLLPALKPFDPYKFADYVLRNNVFSDTDTFVYSGLSGTNPHGVQDRIWAEALAGMRGEFIKTGDLYVVHTPGVERPPTMRAAPARQEPSEELSLETIELLAETEGDPLRKFCCRQCGECAPAELLEEGRFPDRIAWLRHHYKEKHPGMWGKVSAATIPEGIPRRLSLEQVSGLETRFPIEKLWADERAYLDKLTTEIEREGLTEPITIRVRDDGSLIVWDGIHRLAVAQKLGLKDIPVEFIGNISAFPKGLLAPKVALPQAEPVTPEVTRLIRIESRAGGYQAWAMSDQGVEVGIGNLEVTFAKAQTEASKSLTDKAFVARLEDFWKNKGYTFKKASGISEVAIPKAEAGMLEAAVIPTGKCYEDAWRFLIKEQEGELIHGSVQSIGKRINHAWVELPTGFIWEPESGEFMKKSYFYERAEPQVQDRYTAEEAAIMATRTGNHGPWTADERGRFLRKSPAVIPTQPSPPSPKEELEFASDSPEFLAFTIEDIGYREKLDTAFETAIARAKGG